MENISYLVHLHIALMITISKIKNDTLFINYTLFTNFTLNTDVDSFSVARICLHFVPIFRTSNLIL